jgi:hypothetical protein
MTADHARQRIARRRCRSQDAACCRNDREGPSIPGGAVLFLNHATGIVAETPRDVNPLKKPANSAFNGGDGLDRRPADSTTD